MAQARRIDVHHHPSPPSYLTARDGGDTPSPVRFTWTVQNSIDMMDQGGVATSILSLPHSVSIWPDKGAKSRALGPFISGRCLQRCISGWESMSPLPNSTI